MLKVTIPTRSHFTIRTKTLLEEGQEKSDEPKGPAGTAYCLTGFSVKGNRNIK